MTQVSQPEPAKPVILYDGLCGLCNRLNQFVLKRDQRDSFRFASLQSPFAHAVLQRHGADPRDLGTVYIVLHHGQPGERLLAKSQAILHVLQQMGGVWRAARICQVLPRFLRDLVYDLIARHRYRIFGEFESCLVPEAKHRGKFLDA